MTYVVYPRLSWFGLRYRADVVITVFHTVYRVENLTQQQTSELLDLLKVLKAWGSGK